jgi:2-hydroxymethylglutarate dehydrogenase
LSAVGFVGTGTMGQPIARRLLEAGHDLVVFDLNTDASAALVSHGARVVESPSQVAEICRVVFTSLPGPVEVEEAVTGPQGILAEASEGDIHVDLSTNSYEAVRRLAEIEARAGMQLIDAPVSGGVAGLERGTLAVMASGDRAAFERIEPLLLTFSSKVFHLGEVGTGTLTKLVNNLIFLCGGVLVQEGLVLAEKAGLDTDQLLSVLKESSASAYTGLAGFFLGRDFENVIFKLGIAEKDVALALESARKLGVSMPMTKAGHAVYQRAREGGLGDEVFYATLKTLEEAAGIEVPNLDESEKPGGDG